MKPAAEFDAILALADLAPECPAALARQISLGLRWNPEANALAELVLLNSGSSHAAAAKATVCGAREPLLENVRQELTAWFKDPTHAFGLPLAIPRTAFQARLRQFLLAMPCGATCTYGELAQALQSAPRAVGQALGSNTLPLIVPCHRVISAGKNRLTGFNHARTGVMLDLKSWLLQRESGIANAHA